MLLFIHNLSRIVQEKRKLTAQAVTYSNVKCKEFRSVHYFANALARSMYCAKRIRSSLVPCFSQTVVFPEILIRSCAPLPRNVVHLLGHVKCRFPKFRKFSNEKCLFQTEQSIARVHFPNRDNDK